MTRGNGNGHLGGNGNDRGNHRFAIVCPAYVIGKGLPARALEMLMIIAEARCDSTGKTIPLSHGQIADRLDIDFRNVPRYLGRLLAVGALEVLSRGTGPGAPSVYRVIGTTVYRRTTVISPDDGSTYRARATVINADDGTVISPDDGAVINPEDHSVRKKRSRIPVSNETAPNGALNDFTKEVFDAAVRILTRDGISERNARSLIGKCRLQLDNAGVLDLLLSVAKQRPPDPAAYITKALMKREREKQMGGGYRPMPSVAGG
jgi:hypothetical protein